MLFYKLIIISFLFFYSFVYAKDISNFSQAKRLARIVYADHREDFYCQCKFNRHLEVNLQVCGYSPRKNAKRAARIEWDHIVPAEVLGQTRTCWREPLCIKKNGKRYKGRKCCEKIDKIFKKMEADLFNLVPAVGEINNDRANYTFTELGQKPYQYGRCPIVINFGLKKAQPPDYAKGFIARTYFYMRQKYGIPISDKQAKLFNIWDKKYPPDTWELERKRRIEAMQKKLTIKPFTY